MRDHSEFPLVRALVLVPLLACQGEVTSPNAPPGAAAEDLSALVALDQPHLPNNHPIKNSSGAAATYSTQGKVDLTSAFLTPQGTNGRHCGSCHTPEDGWTISAETLQNRFEASLGLDPVFNNGKESDRRGADPVDTVEQRRHAFSMLLQGKFTRRQSVPANAEFEVIAADDPFGIGSTSTFWFFRRSMPTTNFRNHIVSWDGANIVGTDLHAGLARQVRGNITGAQSGIAPVDESIVEDIVQFEKALSHAQILTSSGLRLDAGGVRGGPQYLSQQPLRAGRMNMFDAWIGHNNPEKSQIARGQELFNNVNPPSGRRCGACHNAENDGQNVNGTFFNIGASRPEFASADMAVYTLRNKITGEIMQTTDGGRAWRTGLWADMDRFKTPSLRGLSARGQYYHNGIVKSLMDVVLHYEQALGFVFTAQERADLVAFMAAL